MQLEEPVRKDEKNAKLLYLHHLNTLINKNNISNKNFRKLKSDWLIRSHLKRKVFVQR